MVLSRENIIEGLIDLKNERENESKKIIMNIKEIVESQNIDDMEKLKLINNELGKMLVI
ncbi:hypothetical protein [Romboutsia sp. 1001216sp1]|uniref:hypothetical protein n=1 Tax=Romboutsia sp. 1001216sp1 TaxID=2986997 RepID=UPI00232BAF4C|nr:hypothetical protein [Romboutsia sp. 1001216sp1]MDB8805173.1 hypothetical protein [Romboutsia sp. 1001216sp1]MDB8809065.1 hypothetical protein [Romboutsia sp. 1001216sp1]MDB8810818.1 hypothetical protein [Romboutsia sp. 1001216sp1]MDB8816538.1 hypothetical protein [Romboutsia sp. 1001216sp1]MDB8819177.1 hypothetical protein [Romboutsia sp. 1001216sp1]